MNRNLKITLITAISFAVYFILDTIYFNSFRKFFAEISGQPGISHIFSYFVFGIPLFIGAILMHGTKRFVQSFGLDKSPIEGLLFSLICTLPMLAGYSTAFDLSNEVTFNKLLINVLAAAFFEELYFRGFLFGQIYRYTKFGFIPALVVGAFIFAFIHLYQGQELMTLLGVFFITFLGSALFAWVYAEWEFNIWIPIFLHLLMNLLWMIFSVSGNAFGGIYANLFRTLSLVLIIGLTIFYKRKNKIPFEINKKTIWLKSKI